MGGVGGVDGWVVVVAASNSLAEPATATSQHKDLLF